MTTRRAITTHISVIGTVRTIIKEADVGIRLIRSPFSLFLNAVIKSERKQLLELDLHYFSHSEYNNITLFLKNSNLILTIGSEFFLLIGA